MTRPRPPRAPPERQVTIRARLREVLQEGPRSAHELSAQVGIGEKQVAGHLEHLARSLRAAGQRLQVEPARCLGCGFVFRKRERLDRPSACPRCRSQHIEAPRFLIRATAGAS